VDSLSSPCCSSREDAKIPDQDVDEITIQYGMGQVCLPPLPPLLPAQAAPAAPAAPTAADRSCRSLLLSSGRGASRCSSAPRRWYIRTPSQPRVCGFLKQSRACCSPCSKSSFSLARRSWRGGTRRWRKQGNSYSRCRRNWSSLPPRQAMPKRISIGSLLCIPYVNPCGSSCSNTGAQRGSSDSGATAVK